MRLIKFYVFAVGVLAASAVFPQGLNDKKANGGLGTKDSRGDGDNAPLSMLKLSYELSGEKLPAPLSEFSKHITFPADMWSLARIAVENHPAIRDALAQLAQQQGNVDVAKAGYYPKFTAGVNTAKYSNYYGNSRVFSVSASQMLYDFGKVEGQVDQARANVLKQQAQAFVQIDDTAMQAAQAVNTVHRYQMALLAAQQQKKAVADIVELVRMRYQGGVITASEFLQAKSRLESANALMRQQNTALDQAREHLQSFLGGGDLPARLESPERELEQAWSPKEVDLNLLPKVVAAVADRAIAQGSVKSAVADQYPTISFDVDASKPWQGSVNPADPTSNNWYHVASVNVTSPVFQGGMTQARVRAARESLRGADARVDKARLDAADAIRSLKVQVLGMQQRLALQKDRVASISQASDLYGDQYKLGTRSLIDLLNSVSEIYQARTDVINTEHDMWGMMVEYFAVTGKIREVFALDNSNIQGMDIEP